MGNIVDSYLAEVKTNLSDEHDDILMELRSNIEATIEAKEEQLEKQLTDEQIADILKGFGHPVKVASQFKKQQYLIGPELFLAFTQVLKYSLLAVIAIQGILLVVGYLLGDTEGQSFGGLLYRILHTGINVAIVVTAVFIIMEYYGQKVTWYNNWNPLSSLRKEKIPADRQDSITNIITDSVLFLWWNNWFQIDTSLPFLNDIPIVASDIYQEVFLPVNIILVSSLVLYSWQLLNNAWHKMSLRLAILIDLATLGVLAYLLSAKGYFATTKHHQEFNILLDHLNSTAIIILIVLSGFVVYDLYKHGKNWQQLNAL